MESSISHTSSVSDEGDLKPVPASKEKKFVYKPSEDDVLLGRGNNVNYHPANIEFRKAAQARALQYCQSSKKGEKEQIALDVIANRRFLRPCTISSADSEPFAAWEEVDMPTVIQKTKQALRDAAAAVRKDPVESRGETSSSKRKRKEDKQPSNEIDRKRSSWEDSRMRLDSDASSGVSMHSPLGSMHNPYLHGLVGIGNPPLVGSGSMLSGLNLQQQQLLLQQQLSYAGSVDPSLLGLLGGGGHGLGGTGSHGLTSMTHLDAFSGVNPLLLPSSGIPDTALAMLRLQQERELLMMQYQRRLLLESNQTLQPPQQPPLDHLMRMGMRGDAAAGLRGGAVSADGISAASFANNNNAVLETTLPDRQRGYSDFSSLVAAPSSQRPRERPKNDEEEDGEDDEEEYNPHEDRDDDSGSDEN